MLLTVATAKKVDPTVTPMKQVNISGLMVKVGKMFVLVRKKMMITEVRMLDLTKKP